MMPLVPGGLCPSVNLKQRILYVSSGLTLNNPKSKKVRCVSMLCHQVDFRIDLQYSLFFFAKSLCLLGAGHGVRD